jgi:hypothetical protein
MHNIAQILKYTSTASYLFIYLFIYLVVLVVELKALHLLGWALISDIVVLKMRGKFGQDAMTNQDKPGATKTLKRPASLFLRDSAEYGSANMLLDFQCPEL